MDDRQGYIAVAVDDRGEYIDVKGNNPRGEYIRLAGEQSSPGGADYMRLATSAGGVEYMLPAVEAGAGDYPDVAGAEEEEAGDEDDVVSDAGAGRVALCCEGQRWSIG
jgi:hypothetical protein